MSRYVANEGGGMLIGISNHKGEVFGVPLDHDGVITLKMTRRHVNLPGLEARLSSGGLTVVKRGVENSSAVIYYKGTMEQAMDAAGGDEELVADRAKLREIPIAERIRPEDYGRGR